MKTKAKTPLPEEGPIPALVMPLTYEERTRLRAILAEPVFLKAWQNVQACKPGAVPAGLDSALGQQIGNNRLHQIQGWEMFRAALVRETMERKPVAARLTDNFPDGGTIEADVKRQLEQRKK